MDSCRETGPLVTRVADSEATTVERGVVDAHLRECAPCRFQLHAEREARLLVHDRASALVGHAPLGLRARCAATRVQASPPARRPLPLLSRVGWPMALAATLVLAVAGSAFYGLVVNPSKAVAAQLALDHLKCFALFDEPAALSPAEVQAALKARHGIDVRLPVGKAAEGLTLVGGRRCLYMDGLVAHLLYRKDAVQVSLFVLPIGEKLGQTDLDVLGHSAVAFEKDGRTWVVLARAPHAAVEALAAAFGAVSD
ncbi:MAG: zf-HC2 domain-containing protein [Vicinamibacterales bacterium]